MPTTALVVTPARKIPLQNLKRQIPERKGNDSSRSQACKQCGE